MFDVVLVGADDSSTARRAIEVPAEIVALSGGTLHILSAYDPKLFSDSALPSEFKGQSKGNDGEVEALLQVLSFTTMSKGITPVMHAKTGDAADALSRRPTSLAPTWSWSATAR